MTIDLPEHLEKPIRALVEHGQFASEDEAVAEAVRMLLESQTLPPIPSDCGSLGAMRDAVEDLDAAVEYVMSLRGNQARSNGPGE